METNPELQRPIITVEDIVKASNDLKHETLPGYQITIIPSELVKDGNPIMMMSINDYAQFAAQSEKKKSIFQS